MKNTNTYRNLIILLGLIIAFICTAWTVYMSNPDLNLVSYVPFKSFLADRINTLSQIASNALSALL
jgi:hypothetical protein